MQDKPRYLAFALTDAFGLQSSAAISWGGTSPPYPCDLSVSSAALGRRRRPALNECIVINRLALRFLICELRLRGDVAVLLGLVEPELRALLLVELRPAFALHVGPLQALEHRILGCRKGIHSLLRRLRAGGGVANVLPPELGELRVIGDVVAGRGPQDPRRRAVELDQPSEL